MKPMSPEQKQIDEMGAEVSATYRAAANSEPSARIDAAILDAARREAGKPRGRSWQVPAAVAAVVVLGVSLSLRVRDDFGISPPVEEPARTQAELAKPAPPSLRLQKPESASGQADNQKSRAEERPSRERSTRADRQSESRVAQDALAYKAAEPDRAAEREHMATPAPPSAAAGQDPVPATVARAPAPASVPSLEEVAPAKKDTLADTERGRRIASLRKQEGAGAANALARTAEDWVRALEVLLKEGRNDEARAEFAEFRKRFPEHAVPAALRDLQREYEAK
jgi:TolA-binding protein